MSNGIRQRMRVDIENRAQPYGPSWAAEWSQVHGGRIAVLLIERGRECDRETVVLQMLEQECPENETELVNQAAEAMMALAETWKTQAKGRTST